MNFLFWGGESDVFSFEKTLYKLFILGGKI